MTEIMSQAWVVDITALDALEIGAGILGTGGGGNPYIGKLRARQILRDGHVMKVLPLEALADDAKVVPVGGIGAPVVSSERIKEGKEGVRSLRALEDHLGIRAEKT